MPDSRIAEGPESAPPAPGSRSAFDRVRSWRPTEHASRLVAQGLILALVTGGTGAFAVMHKSVSVDVDGSVVEVSAFGRTVDDVLVSAGIDVDEGDLVAPGRTDAIADGGEIVVRHGREVTVALDGEDRAVWTTALTVGEAVADLGVRGDGARVSASRSSALGRDDVLRVSTLKTIHLAVDGRIIEGTSSAPTVGGVLQEIGLVLAEGDQVSVPLAAIPVDGLVILVTRAAQGSGTVSEVMPFTERVVEDASIAAGTRTVTTTGVVGERQITFATDLLGGAEVSRTVLASVVLRAPVEQVVTVGTMVVVDAPIVTPTSAQAIGRELAAGRGWGSDQFSCLVELWTHESGWNVSAENPSSGAYGIPQSLPGSKMAAVAGDWRTNPATQITWGLNYIGSRYGTPCGAWQSFSAKGWY